MWQFVDPVWQQHLNTRAALDMSRLNSFIRCINWWQLIPSGLNEMKTLIADANNADTSAPYVSAAAARDGSLMVAYIPPAHQGSITADMTALSNTANAFWFDPTNGKYLSIKDLSLANKGFKIFTPPGKNSTGENDWVLILLVGERRAEMQRYFFEPGRNTSFTVCCVALLYVLNTMQLFYLFYLFFALPLQNTGCLYRNLRWILYHFVV